MAERDAGYAMAVRMDEWYQALLTGENNIDLELANMPVKTTNPYQRGDKKHRKKHGKSVKSVKSVKNRKRHGK